MSSRICSLRMRYHYKGLCRSTREDTVVRRHPGRTLALLRLLLVGTSSFLMQRDSATFPEALLTLPARAASNRRADQRGTPTGAPARVARQRDRVLPPVPRIERRTTALAISCPRFTDARSRPIISWARLDGPDDSHARTKRYVREDCSKSPASRARVRVLYYDKSGRRHVPDPRPERARRRAWRRLLRATANT